MSRLREDRGSVAVELVIVAPLFVLLFAAMIAVGRTNDAHADVEAAARMAARDLAIARDPSSYAVQAQENTAATLKVGRASCESMAFRTTITDERVEVTVSCDVAVQEASLLPLPGHLTISATASEVRDRYREATG